MAAVDPQATYVTQRGPCQRPVAGVCVPQHDVDACPRYERLVLLLAMALMEAFGITVEVSNDADLHEIEGFVLGE